MTAALYAAAGVAVGVALGLLLGAGLTRRRGATDVPPLFTGAFWLLALERAGKSAAQGALLAVGAGQLDVLSADWRAVLGAAAGMAVLSLLTSVVSSPVGPTGSPSLVAAPPLTPPADG